MENRDQPEARAGGLLLVSLALPAYAPRRPAHEPLWRLSGDTPKPGAVKAVHAQ